MKKQITTNYTQNFNKTNTEEPKLINNIWDAI